MMLKTKTVKGVVKRVWERRVQTSRRERRTLSVFVFFICVCISLVFVFVKKPSLGEPLLKRHLLRSMEYLAVGIHYKCSLANQTNFCRFTVTNQPCLKSDVGWDIHSHRLMQAQQSTLNNQISLSQTSLAVIPRGKGEPPLEHLSGQTFT